MAKQYMLKHLRRQYKRIGTMFDDSPFNIKGARLQKIGAIHIPKNEEYWSNNFELVTKVWLWMFPIVITTLKRVLNLDLSHKLYELAVLHLKL